MTTFFADLGRRIQERWVRAKCSEAAFPTLCAEALTETPPASNITLDELVTWGLTCGRLPQQVDAKSDFGEPPLTVFSEERFYISVLVWLDGTTEIHEHAFSGAFQVLHGGSLHTTFDLEDAQLVNESMMLGRLKERRVERLVRGDTREIHPGAATIHQLFHLERPSATVVIRTLGASYRRPQYSYFRPGIAVEHRYDFEEQKRRRDLLRLVARTQPERLGDLCMRWLEVADFVGGFLGLRHALTHMSPTEGDELLARAEERHPELARLVRQVIESDRREAFIVRRRATVRDPELRFFLAVLLNLEGRDNSLRIIAERFPGADPADRIVQWVRALSAVASPDGKEPNALGFEVDDVVAAALRSALRGQPLDALFADIATIATRSLTDEEKRGAAELRRALVDSELFRSMLR